MLINIADNQLRPIVQTATFTDFLFEFAKTKPHRRRSVCIFGQKADGTMSTVAEDVEPEYISISEYNQTAYVSLQRKQRHRHCRYCQRNWISDIQPLGAKDHSLEGNELDVSNDDGKINITTWPIMGMYMPDAIDTYSIGDKHTGNGQRR